MSTTIGQFIYCGPYTTDVRVDQSRDPRGKTRGHFQQSTLRLPLGNTPSSGSYYTSVISDSREPAGRERVSGHEAAGGGEVVNSSTLGMRYGVLP